MAVRLLKRPATDILRGGYATGRTTRVVLGAGDGVTHAAPIYEGFAIPHSIMRINIAGCDVSRVPRQYLRKEGHDFHTSSKFEIVRATIWHAGLLAKIRNLPYLTWPCFLSIKPQKDEALESEKAQYMLP
ncbi:hypothetical protein SKAU_G00141150 [Synaphobranchus kaupii]|uniref:Uncharacterized protein n=1 Tax=Synaphobranchus kaupii TaxID=118154 RepID=A0A9Q1J3B3_SYNKA|nr:hypothetical protein SKAU_G00141150 [Synaphobranchus kaupii]